MSLLVLCECIDDDIEIWEVRPNLSYVKQYRFSVCTPISAI